MGARQTYVLAAGTAFPGPLVDNAVLATRFAATGAWQPWVDTFIGTRTRHLAVDPETGESHATLADLGEEAGGEALAGAGLAPGEIDLVVLGSATPDQLMPATVNLIADRLVINDVPTYPLQSGCTGAVQALDLARQLLCTGRRLPDRTVRSGQSDPPRRSRADVVPARRRGGLRRSPVPWRPADVRAVFDEKLAALGKLASIFEAHSKGTLVLNTLPLPHRFTAQLVDPRSRAELGALWREANARLLRFGEQHPGVLVIDLKPLLAGGIPVEDPRLSVYAKVHLSTELLARYAREIGHLARNATGRTKKCLVLDLDGTVWGGILGEDGHDGVEVAETHHGEAFGAFQRVVKQIGAQGVLLAVVSRNDFGPVRKALTENPRMTLHEQDFVRVTAADAGRGLDELPGWDSVYLLWLLTVVEKRTGRPVSLPDLLEAGSLADVYSLVAA